MSLINAETAYSAVAASPHGLPISQYVDSSSHASKQRMASIVLEIVTVLVTGKGMPSLHLHGKGSKEEESSRLFRAFNHTQIGDAMREFGAGESLSDALTTSLVERKCHLVQQSQCLGAESFFE